MRKFGLFAITIAVILAGAAWAPSTTHAPTDTLAGPRLGPSQMMVNVKALPVDDFVDYTFVFPGH